VGHDGRFEQIRPEVPMEKTVPMVTDLEPEPHPSKPGA
jgi:hypothetical protein